MAKRSFSKFRSKWWALCEIDRQIRSGRPCSCASLGRDLEVNARTVRRYIAFMREELDAPIEYDPIDGRYTLTDTTWTMPNVHLSEGELIALAVATRSMSALTPEPFTAPLEKLFGKLLEALPEERRKELTALRERVDIVPAAVSSKGQEWVEPLLEAIRDQRTIEMRYYALSKDSETTRRVDPYHLRFFAGAWYLIGYDHPTKQFPLFNLARVRQVEVLEETFRRRAFSAEEYFRNSFGISVGGTPRKVRVRLIGRAAKTAAEKQWPKGFVYTAEPDGSGLLVGKASRMEDILTWAASFDGDAVILPEDNST